jgi:hypothetical protein
MTSRRRIRAYLYDPDSAKTKRVKRLYRGVCGECSAST